MKEDLLKNNAGTAAVGVSPKTGVSAAICSQKGSGRTHDFYPLIPSAGVASARDRFTARDAIHCDTRESSTSRWMNPYKTTSAAAFGLPAVQHGLSSNMRSAGRATGVKEHGVGSLLSNQFPATPMGRFLLQQQEKIYRGLYSKPLGRSVPQRGVQLPDPDESYRFGIKQTTDEVDAAKKLIFAPVPEPTEKELALYKQTHHSYLPGEAVDRRYAVKHIDLHTFCFGKKTSTDDGIDAKQCINWTAADEGKHVVSKAINDYHLIRHSEVGKCARSAAGRPPVPPGFSFGLPTAHDGGSAEDCFEMCIPGECHKQQATTKNCSSEHKEKGTTSGKPAGADERIFGIPTVRTDIKPPKRRSIHDQVNYGDEPAIGELLFPSPLMVYDIKGEAFSEQLSKEQIKDLLCRSIGSSGETAELVYRAVDLAFEKATKENRRKPEKEIDANGAEVSQSDGSPASAASTDPKNATDGCQPCLPHEGAEPTTTLADVLEVYAALIKKKVALETRSLTHATELYIQPFPAITFQ